LRAQGYAAIRDHVFQALRCRASYAWWLGGAQTGRGVMLGAMRAAEPDEIGGIAQRRAWLKAVKMPVPLKTQIAQ
jgi:hypothetical protein